MTEWEGEQGKILIVDDAETNRLILEEILKDGYELEQAADGYEAMAALIHAQRLPDLVLLDIMMPEMDGLEVFSIMKNNPLTATIPVMFITASGRTEHEIKGLRMGAADYITKPFLPEVVRLRVDNCIELTRYRRHLEQEVEKKVSILTRTRENMLEVLAGMVEYRDIDSGEHIKRTSELAGLIIDKMLKDPEYSQVLRDLDTNEIVRAAAMHDIGKIGIPDSILLKPGKLTNEEFEEVKRHTIIGGEIMDSVMRSDDDSYYKHCKDICLYHHERWDGKGYPHGLKGTDIPLSARIISVIDVYDALVSKRPYKEPFDHETALRIISEGTGTQFDPNIVGALKLLWQGENSNEQQHST